MLVFVGHQQSPSRDYACIAGK